MTDGGFDSPRPDGVAGETKRRETIDPRYVIDTLTQKEQSKGLFEDIDLQMVVGSGGMVLNGLLTTEQHPIKDLDTVTATHQGEVATRVRKLFDEERGKLHLCNETSDVFLIKPATGEFADKDGPYPIYNIIHMLTWARPHIVTMSDYFKDTVMQNACKGILSNTQVSELPPDYLIAAESIGGLLEKDFTKLSIPQIKNIVDTATQYKLDYYLGNHTDGDVKTSVSLPSKLKWGILSEKLLSFGIH